MRRIISLLMLCALLVGSLPVPAVYAEAVQDGDFTYLLGYDDTYTITDYSGKSTVIAIPSEFNGKPVTAIGASAFDQLNNPGQPQLKSVTIPPSVTMISNFAFAHNDLTAIEIPSVTSIGRGAFQYNQLQRIVLGEVTFLDAYAFADNQIESVTIPDSLGTIGEYAFQNNQLSSVSFPEGLERIDNYAFAGNRLTTILFPKSMIAINSGAFMNNQLGNVAIPPYVNLGSGDQYQVFNNNPNVAIYVPITGSALVQNHTSKYQITTVPCKYNIAYDENGSTGGTAPLTTSYVCYNQTFAVPDQGSLTKDGYTFKGWNTMRDGSGTNYFGGNYPIIYGNPSLRPGFTLYANWEAKSPHQVTFDTGWGATNPEPQTILHGDHIVKPLAPSRTDYNFEGWYTDSGYADAWDFNNDIVTEDMTLYAKWKWNGANIASVKLTTTVEKVTGGDPLIVTVAVKDDNNLPIANAVVHLSSNLGEWTLTGNGDLSATTSSNGMLNAVWTAPWVTDSESVTITASVDGMIGMRDSQTFQVVPLYSVSYVTNAETDIPATTASAGVLLDKPTPAPTKEGYRFAGWYLDPYFKTEWNFDLDKVAGDITLYAKWESKQLAISLAANSSIVLSGREISVTGTVYDEDDVPKANISVQLSSSSGGKWSASEADMATVTTDDNGAFKVSWEAPYVSETVTVELSASLEGSNAEPATLSIQVNPLPGPVLSSDADLAGLKLSGVDVTPLFQAKLTDYTANVGFATTSVALVPEVSNQAATVSVNGDVAETGQPVQINLNVGSNLVEIVVTAEDGTTTKTYRITIMRASAPVVPIPVDPIPVAGVTVTSVQSSVYEGDTLQMSVNVSPNDAANKQVSWSIQNGTGMAVIDGNGLLRADHAGTVTVKATALDGSGNVGSKVITIYERQAGDGDTTTPPTDPITPTNPTPPSDPTTLPSEKPPVLNVVPGKPPIDVNDAESIHTMLETLSAKFNDSSNANVPDFPDAKNHWAADSIRLFANLGIVRGYEDGTFKPDDNITRGEFASMLVKLFPFAQGTAETTEFTDLGDSWARAAVLTLASNGIISGYEDGTFQADRNITRAEMIAILARIVNLAAVKQEKTVNLRDIDHTWAKDQIQLAANAGIIKGRSETVFDPNKGATRAEVVTVLLRAISLSPEIEQLLEELN